MENGVTGLKKILVEIGYDNNRETNKLILNYIEIAENLESGYSFEKETDNFVYFRNDYNIALIINKEDFNNYQKVLNAVLSFELEQRNK